MLLEVESLSVQYGAFKALSDVSLTVAEGQLVSIVGANGAGKTTLINSISGLLKPTAGEILFDGKDILRMPAHQVVREGLVQVPEGRKLFPEFTVRENLLVGGTHQRARPLRAQAFKRVFSLFPILEERQKQLARTLSGGEQQMLAIGRALMAQPRILLMDEPSLGLAPIVIQSIFSVMRELKRMGLTVLLVEQNVRHSLQIADYAYVLETGTVVLEGTGQQVLSDKHTIAAYIGM